MNNRFILLFLLLLLLPGWKTQAQQEEKPVIYQIDIDSEIGTTSWIILQNGLREARELNAKAIVLRLNTYGGAVLDADSMRTALLYSPIPVSVFIDNNAASAGALISIACKNIYMRKGSNIGAATVVNQTGEQLPDKYQSYMRAMMRATAEAQGKDTIIQNNDTIFKWKRDPAIAEAMVDESISLPGIIEEGKVISFTTEEAIRYGFCDGIAESVEDVIRNQLNYKEYQLVQYQPSLYDKMKGFLMSPYFQAILIMVIIGGIYFELQTPGIGFPSIAAILAAILYFAPLYIDGLAQNWEIIIFVLGLLLIMAEIFVIPGLGVAGISGAVLIITGLTFALLNNDYFSFEAVEVPDVSRSVITVFSGITLSIFIIIYLSSRIGTKGIFRKIALTTDLEHSKMEVETEENPLTGCSGETVTIMRPSGKIKIGNEIYDAVSVAGYIEKGTKVTVVKTENTQLYVEPS